MAHAACLTIASNPDGAPLVLVALPPDEAVFRVTYRQSVTRTPVEERYRVDGDAIVETEIRFEQHGPGLPTEPDAGERWVHRDGRFIVSMNRWFPHVVMRVDADTQPILAAGADAIDLAQWGNRALVLRALRNPCPRP
jgi:hypothetical protein